MQKTKIEWTDYTWNPIKGICPVGCWYCYARRMYQRFKWNPKIEIDPNKLVSPYRLSKPSKIFLCSTIELFHPDIHPSWREVIFNVIKECPPHTFQILTKFPQNIDQEMPDNVWLGITLTGERREWEAFYLGHLAAAQARLKFISIEPLLSSMAWIKDLFYLKHFNWIIIGRLTQHGHKYDPKKEWIEQIVKKAKSDKVPIFLKDNLKEIWAEPLIQEFPDGA